MGLKLGLHQGTLGVLTIARCLQVDERKRKGWMKPPKVFANVFSLVLGGAFSFGEKWKL